MNPASPNLPNFPIYSPIENLSGGQVQLLASHQHMKLQAVAANNVAVRQAREVVVRGLGGIDNHHGLFAEYLRGLPRADEQAGFFAQANPNSVGWASTACMRRG